MKTYKGHKYDNTVIEVLTEKHGQSVVNAFWIKQGIDTNNYYFNCSREGKYPQRYYGLINGIFDNYTKDDLQGVQILTLPVEPETPAFPYFAKFWDEDEFNYSIGYVVAKIDIGNPVAPFVCTINKNVVNGEKYKIACYRHAEPINETLECVSEKLKVLNESYTSLNLELTELRDKIDYLTKLKGKLS